MYNFYLLEDFQLENVQFIIIITELIFQYKVLKCITWNMQSVHKIILKLFRSISSMVFYQYCILLPVTAQLCLGMFVFHLQFFLFGIFLSVFFENKTNTQIESGMCTFTWESSIIPVCHQIEDNRAIFVAQLVTIRLVIDFDLIENSLGACFSVLWICATVSCSKNNWK